MVKTNSQTDLSKVSEQQNLEGGRKGSQCEPCLGLWGSRS